MKGRPPKCKRLTPQQKEALFYLKDRRNVYGENDKSSRKNIPLGKARLRRSVRRVDKMAIAADPTSDAVLPARRQPKWDQAPDAPIGAILEGRQLTWDLSRDFPSRATLALRRARRVDKT